jgi:type I restriction-modification system DNA methylase subunit
MQFKDAQISQNNLSILKSRFEFIKTDASLSKKKGVLLEIIDDINNNINTFIRTHEYFDVLGQLYIEFLRYANSDKGLGIVLTPPHITEFMAMVAEVNADSIVYDSCTGTGGFLVSAMNVMVKDARGDQEKIKSIKKNQLIGVEYQAHIYALACSNMFIHQDGKTSIINGDCFDREVIDGVKEKRPNAGLLNPPYKSDKKKDTEELEFVLSNLECLELGGKCVAIVPMQSAIAQNGKIAQLKEKLLRNHTLEAVFSMPNELFFNSKVGVVSCVMVFTSKRPHPKGKKTFFGYFKDDGHVIRRAKGRVDVEGKFKNVILDKWLTTYINREELPSFSVTQEVGSSDEWCAEAYMETDYSVLSRADFETEMKKYIAYKVQSS